MINDKSNINIISPEDKKIQFCAFDRAGESLFAFWSSICLNDVVKRLHFLDVTKIVAENLRKGFLEIDFDLSNKVCGGKDLIGSCYSLPLSDEKLTFL